MLIMNTKMLKVYLNDGVLQSLESELLIRRLLISINSFFNNAIFQIPYLLSNFLSVIFKL